MQLREKGWSRVVALTAALAAGLVGISSAHADQSSSFSDAGSNPTYSLSTPTSGQTTVGWATNDEAKSSNKPLMLDAAPAEEAPNIHGFFNSPFKTAYVTPRGLVVENAGLVWQPVLGLVLPIGDLGPFKNFAVVGGIWNSVNTAQAGNHPASEFIGAWNEMDVFVGPSWTMADFSFALTYGAWNSPPHNFRTEHNLYLKIAYNDGKAWGDSGFAINPYTDLWWAISGDSTVILGQHGGTGYVELGVAPSYTLKMISGYPIALSLPTYFSVGPRTYWADNGLPGGNFGLISCSLNASVPLSFIPVKYGHWHADVGVTYDYLINQSLRDAGTLASGNTDHNVIVGSVGFGFGF